ncbi:MAG: phosphodiesterase [Ruminococcaceae bacterium]|nr:phosphodiesterase [Oscillospiraceae bacterium]
MKFFFASDLHGDLNAARAMAAAFERERAERLFLLGDLLYHGPRNNIPSGYDPRGVIALLSELKSQISAVRGNCDAEVDQMVLPFPIMADYAVLPLGEHVAYLTHGHLFDGGVPAEILPGDILIEGHTHVAGISTTKAGVTCLNPGSVSMPKGDTPACYMVYDSKTLTFTVCRLADGSVFCTYTL